MWNFIHAGDNLPDSLFRKVFNRKELAQDKLKGRAKSKGQLYLFNRLQQLLPGKTVVLNFTDPALVSCNSTTLTPPVFPEKQKENQT